MHHVSRLMHGCVICILFPASATSSAVSERRWHCAWPRRDNRQQTDDGRSSRRRLKVDLLPASPTADDRQVAVNRHCENGGTGVHHVPSGLLQLVPVRHYWRSTPAPSVRAECSGTPCVGNSSPRPHHTSPAMAALAARQAACRVQSDTVSVQGDPRSAPPYLAATV